MASRLIVLAVALSACNAGPVWFIDNGYIPGTVFYREARAPVFAEPSIAYGFGSGFSSNIAGINHNTAIGASIQSGNAQAYGAGGAGSDGTSFARGVGYANANPQPTQQLYRTNYPYAYNPYNGLRNSYENSILSAQTTGNTAAAQTYNAPYGHNFRGTGYGSAAASSNGYGSAATSSSNGSGTAISSAQSRDALGASNTVVSATQVLNGVVASTAHSTQQHAGYLKHAGATTYKGRGIEASHSSVINTSPEYY